MLLSHNIEVLLVGNISRPSKIMVENEADNNTGTGRGGGGGRRNQGKMGYSPPASITSRLAPVTFKMASKVFIEKTDKNFDFITEILFRFHGFGDFKVPIVKEN